MIKKLGAFPPTNVIPANTFTVTALCTRRKGGGRTENPQPCSFVRRTTDVVDISAVMQHPRQLGLSGSQACPMAARVQQAVRNLGAIAVDADASLPFADSKSCILGAYERGSLNAKNQ